MCTVFERQYQLLLLIFQYVHPLQILEAMSFFFFFFQLINFGYFTLIKNSGVIFISINYTKIILWFFFFFSQMILMIWNALNDLSGYFHNNCQADCCSNHRSSVLCGGPLYAIAFLLPWLPWKYYHEGDWFSGLHLVVSLCAFDSTLTFFQQAQCVLFTEIFTRYFTSRLII